MCVREPGSMKAASVFPSQLVFVCALCIVPHRRAPPCPFSAADICRVQHAVCGCTPQVGVGAVNGGLYTYTYTLTIPADPGIALPGYWHLFAVNAAGVPSVSWTMLVTLP